MSKEKKAKPVDVTKMLQTIADEEAMFTPTKLQREVKSRFWQILNDNPLLLAQAKNINPNMIRRVTSCSSSIEQWWKIEDFRDYFLNNNTFKENLRGLEEMALDVLYKILANPNLDGDAKVMANQLKAAQEVFALNQRHNAKVVEQQAYVQETRLEQLSEADLQQIIDVEAEENGNS